MELTEEQKQIVIDNANEITDLTDLTRLVFPDDENIDGRSKAAQST